MSNGSCCTGISAAESIGIFPGNSVREKDSLDSVARIGSSCTGRCNPPAGVRQGGAVLVLRTSLAGSPGSHLPVLVLRCRAA